MILVGDVWLPRYCPHYLPKLSQGPRIDADLLGAAVAHVRNTARALDIGAHVGIWTRQLAEVFDEVVAFEPDPENFDCLMCNTRGLPNVRRFCCALHDGHGICRLHRSDDTGETYVNAMPERGDPLALMTTLDSLEPWCPAGLVKIDVEGMEATVLAAGMDYLERQMPVVVLEESSCAPRYGFEPGYARHLLEQLGMRVVYRAPPQSGTGDQDVVLAWR